MRTRVGVIGAALLTLVGAAPAQASLDPGSEFYAPPPNAEALRQIDRLRSNGQAGAARKLEGMVHVPGSVWFVDGTPADVREYAQETVAAASSADAVPVLVPYNVPGRDCGSYSAGGAANGNAYKAWIDALVEGIGQAEAVVVIEPDGLPRLPQDCGLPDTYNRVALINYAVHAFLADANAHVYIDAGHSDWNTPAVMASRLVDAGVLDVDGFALNTSNFQFNQNLAHYGRWVSSCVEYGANVNPGHFDACPDQYGSEDGTALSPFGKWSDSASKAKFNTSAENGRYAELLGSSDSSVHFVIDSSRNGLGPWAGTAAHPASRGNTAAWCNPPDRGAGKRPTANTGVVLLDAYLWVKVPGESDGRCFRWSNGPNDPVRHRRDPAAGAWFGEQALEFARLAAAGFH